jgi:hypothetical protein
MTPPKAVRPHGGVRGADLSRSSLLFGGPFGRIFRVVPPADFGDTDKQTDDNLTALAAKMNADADPAKDGPDAEESGIPAAYTYLGQFIDHDLTFDPASSLQKQNDPDALVDYRTPRFDLDNVYGRGPDDQPYMYEDDGKRLLRGARLTGAAKNPNATDLPRSHKTDPVDGQLHPNTGRAIIGDPRNDENIIVSQLQGLLHRFHNRIVKDNPTLTFPQVQQIVRFHYQWMVVHDFLPTIVDADVLEAVLPGSKAGKPDIENLNLKYFHPKDEAYMPLEFSAAAYRFGHSMVRPGYRLSETQGPLPLFANDPAKDLRGFQPPPNNAAIDWRRFIDLEPLDYGTLVDNPDQKDPKNQNRLQLAYRIDTSLVNPLSQLPPRVATNPNILALRNLQRGWRMRLPSGQSVAKAMGLVPKKTIQIGKFTGADGDIKVKDLNTFAGNAFKDNCPLWVYTLAETVESAVTVKTLQGDKQISTRKLGPVGGTIVAETFLGLLNVDSSSYFSLDPLWTPSLAVNGVFGLRELIRHALGDS